MLNLFQSIYPQTHLLQGGIAVIAQGGVPGFEKAMRILHSWLEGRFFDLDFMRRRNTFFDDIVQILELSMTLCPSGSAERILRAPCYTYSGSLPQELVRDGVYVVHELVQSLMVVDGLFVTKGIFAMRYAILIPIYTAQGHFYSVGTLLISAGKFPLMSPQFAILLSSSQDQSSFLMLIAGGDCIIRRCPGPGFYPC